MEQQYIRIKIDKSYKLYITSNSFSIKYHLRMNLLNEIETVKSQTLANTNIHPFSSFELKNNKNE